ncbi:MAG: cryptochrome/photolyase family protein [Neomegalonema sp.]
MVPQRLRTLRLVLGDQLDAQSAIFDDFDPAQDALLMSEAAEEASYVPQHKKRIALFFGAMRHFAQAQRKAGRPIIYNRLDDDEAPRSLSEGMRAAVESFAPKQVLVVQPGDARVLDALRGAAKDLGVALSVLEDRHFLTQPSDFQSLREGRKRFILEDFYRAQRKRSGWLMQGDQPEGGQWNFDKDNRKPFGREGPGLVPRRMSFEPDAITQDVLKMVAQRFADAPGKLDGFDEPVTAEQAREALQDFIDNRLASYGDYQDAIATGQVTLYHARVSAVMNLKLLDPREACLAAITAWEEGRAPLNAVEGFVRQILGWREFVRGVYWTLMPEYAERNHLGAAAEVPAFFWTGETDMACLSDALGGLVETGYAHHIQRLMVMGLFLMLLGARPYKVHEWHMSMYLDAIDWVSLPNVLGMSQHGDGGVVGTKPYSASGAYIDRMSDCCRGCRYNPKQATGEAACPFTALYWDFLSRHADRFSKNQRMAMQMRNVSRKNEEELAQIRRTADSFKKRLI